ncbi:MAG: hypothetical protein LUE06_01815 [Oscillospiraceae bacterium]|nr:hypothetical protein [Oscillospiraceae bacterium]
MNEKCAIKEIRMQTKMASYTVDTKKDGKVVYKVHVSSHGRRVTRSWHPQAGWSAKTIDRELNKFAANLENELAAGKIQTRAEKIAAKKQQKPRPRKSKPLRNMQTACLCPQRP